MAFIETNWLSDLADELEQKIVTGLAEIVEHALQSSQELMKMGMDHSDPVTERESFTAEKCLLYVALTRAQKQAYITCYGKNRNSSNEIGSDMELYVLQPNL